MKFAIRNHFLPFQQIDMIYKKVQTRQPCQRQHSPLLLQVFGKTIHIPKLLIASGNLRGHHNSAINFCVHHTKGKNNTALYWFHHLIKYDFYVCFEDMELKKVKNKFNYFSFVPQIVIVLKKSCCA